MDTEVLDRPKVPVTARPKTTADILEAAALVIEEFGWHQGGWGGLVSGFCILGAVVEAGGGHRQGPLVLIADAPWAALNALCGYSPALWNDKSGRQSYEVTAALREAAKRARAVTTRSAQDGS